MTPLCGPNGTIGRSAAYAGSRQAAARAAGSSLLAAALVTYLDGDHSGAVYEQPAAFSAFIRGGGNVPLYESVSTALAGIYEAQRPAGLLDIGCGDGIALISAPGRSTHAPAFIDLIEPSAAQLAAAEASLRAADRTAEVRAWARTAQDAVADLPAGVTWSVAQSTFALHALPPAERSTVLARLRPRIGLLAVTEFDVPDLPAGGPGHLGFLADAYERGLAEYGADRDLVAQGFLLPVLAGQLAPGAVRSTWEQPAAAWRRQLDEAGYTGAASQPLYDYWSSPAFLITARGAAPG